MNLKSILIQFVCIILLLLLATLPFVFTSIKGKISIDLKSIVTKIYEFIAGLFDGSSFYYLNHDKQTFFFDTIGKTFPVSFIYITTALLLVLVFSVLFGIYFHRFFRKRLQSMFEIVGIIPDYILILLLQFGVILLLQKTGIKLVTISTFTMDEPAIALPLIVLFILPFVYLTQSLSDVTNQVVTEDYIRTARSKGLNNFQIYHHHVTTNVLPFLKADLHKVISMMVGNLFVVEFLFNIKGVTSLLFPMTNGFQYNLFIFAFLSLFTLYSSVYLLSYGIVSLFERVIGHGITR